MTLFTQIIQFVLIISILVILHELGHFIPAKLFKTKVEKFFLFFDAKFAIFQKKIGETVYGIGWLPLGGYVKISGMIDESMDKEQMALPPQPWEFRSKPAWQRLIIMLGGVTVNFILAFIIYIGMAFAYGDTYIANEDLKDGLLVENKTMQNVGFRTGDHIVSVDGEKIVKFDNDLTMKVIMAKEVLILRNGAEQAIKMPNDFVDQLSQQEKSVLLDIRMPFVVGAVTPGSKNTALQPKDIILALNGQATKYFDQAKAVLESNKNKTIVATILRDDKEIKVPVAVTNDGKLGIGIGRLGMESLEKLGYYKISKQEFGFMESIPVGITKGKDQLVGYGKQLKMIFSPSTGAYKQVGGFKAIFDIFPNSWSWEIFWTRTALLSIMLGVMNLLP
ncbi:MAG: RIP metalloprotease RseP, partial [Flavobacterium sp.]|nr:RIP metalloprotease RseP [Flavobacterium sp.]